MNKIAITSLAAVAALATPSYGQDAESVFKTAFNEACMLDEERSIAEYYPDESWTLAWEDEYSDTPNTATLYQFFCFAGAYNVNLVYMLEDKYDGLVPLAFAVPAYDVKYENDDFDGAVESIKVRGFTTLIMLTNPVFDPEAGTIENSAHWRGLGDASAGGRWVFDKGEFVLKSYDVDASYDGEINPERIVEFK